MNRFVRWTDWPKYMQCAVIVALLLVIGYLDFATGPHISMSAFYLLPISLAAWYIGLRFSLVIAVGAVVVWLGGNTINGDVDFLNPGLAAWNGGVQLVSFVVVVVALARLRSLQHGLETRVRERTASLEALQRNLLQISEREQRRIGQELHDGLCQHLAGAAFTCQSLTEDLTERKLAEAKTAQHVVDLIKEGIHLSRHSAKGLYPVELTADGLMRALEDFSETTSKLFHISCRFSCDAPVLIHDETEAANLYRIAQESVRNALTHGKATEIVISLNSEESGLELLVADNGIGIDHAPKRQGGMGLVIMPRRAAMIGATFEVKERPEGGTLVRCLVALAPTAGNDVRERESA